MDHQKGKNFPLTKQYETDNETEEKRPPSDKLDEIAEESTKKEQLFAKLKAKLGSCKFLTDDEFSQKQSLKFVYSSEDEERRKNRRQNIYIFERLPRKLKKKEDSQQKINSEPQP